MRLQGGIVLHRTEGGGDWYYYCTCVPLQLHSTEVDCSWMFANYKVLAGHAQGIRGLDLLSQGYCRQWGPH